MVEIDVPPFARKVVVYGCGGPFATIPYQPLNSYAVVGRGRETYVLLRGIDRLQLSILLEWEQVDFQSTHIQSRVLHPYMTPHKDSKPIHYSVTSSP
jgi:hypothetical protein